MSNIKNPIENEFETLNGEFIFLLDTRPEDYFDAVMEITKLMSSRGKGVYVIVSRPYRFILNEMQRRKINTDNILFLDCISAMAGEHGDKVCKYVESPAALEEIGMHIGLLLDKIESKEKFLILDSISALLIYNSKNSLKEFSMFLINRLRLEKVTGVLVIIEKEIPDDLKQILIAMCDKVIYV